MAALCARGRAPSVATPEPRPLLSGIILAAGASTRMGRPKQLLLLGDRCLLQHVIDAAVASCLDEIIVVLGHCAEEIRQTLQLPASRVRIVMAADYAQGQSASLRAGLRAASPQASAAAILLGDQPQVTSRLIDRMAREYLNSKSAIVRPVYRDPDGGRVLGHPVFFARRIWPEVEKLEGDQGARAVLSAHPEWVSEIPIDGAPLVDIDTAEDHRRAASPTRPD
jgi:molybdenum cofactor cytidylyltransferase